MRFLTMDRSLFGTIIVYNIICTVISLSKTSTTDSHQAGCTVEPPPVPNSYREFDGKGNIIFTCRSFNSSNDNQNFGGQQIIRACADKYPLNDFRFCDFNCGPKYPEETGAKIVQGGQGASDKGDGSDMGMKSKNPTSSYACIDNYQPVRNYPSALHAKCDKSTETYLQPKIGCFVVGRNWVRGQSVTYISNIYWAEGSPPPEQLTTDEDVKTYVLMDVNQSGPEWSSFFDLSKGAGDDEDGDIWTNSADSQRVEVIAVAISFFQIPDPFPLPATIRVLDSRFPDKQPYLCSDNILEPHYYLLRCQFSKRHYPIGDKIEIDFPNIPNSILRLNEIMVFGRRWRDFCTAPPPLHGMRLVNFTDTDAHYVCESSWRQTADIKVAYCTENRTWDLPDKVCSDQSNLALGTKAKLSKADSLQTGTWAKDQDLKHGSSLPDFSSLTDGDLNTCVRSMPCQNLQDYQLLVPLSGLSEVETVLITYREEEENDLSELQGFSVIIGEKICETSRTFLATSSSYIGQTVRFDCSKIPIGYAVNITLKPNLQVTKDHTSAQQPKPKATEGHTSQCKISLCEVDVLGYSLPDTKTRLECFRQSPGLDYKGCISLTLSGRQCQAWNETMPNAHPYTNDKFFADEDVISSGHNYCRYPTSASDKQMQDFEIGEDVTLSKAIGSGSGSGLFTATRIARAPWCYTTDPDVEWEECGVPTCAEICAFRHDKADYIGEVSQTRGKKTCIKWPNGNEESDTRGFAFMPDFPDWNFRTPSEHNFCRNPASSQSSVWCYVDKSGPFELCDVPDCPVSPSPFFRSHKVSLGKLDKLIGTRSFDMGSVFQDTFHSKISPFDMRRLKALCSAPYFRSFITLYLLNVKPFEYINLFIDCTKKPGGKGASKISKEIIGDADDCGQSVIFGTNSNSVFGRTLLARDGSATVGHVKRKCVQPGTGNSTVVDSKDGDASNPQIPTTGSGDLSASLARDSSKSETDSDEANDFRRLEERFLNAFGFQHLAEGGRSFANLCSFLAHNSKPWCRCPCPCGFHNDLVMGTENVQRMAAKIQKNLKVDPSTMSRQLRRKICASDWRPSAVGCGTLAIAITVAICAWAVAGDIIKMAIYILNVAKSFAGSSVRGQPAKDSKAWVWAISDKTAHDSEGYL